MSIFSWLPSTIFFLPVQLPILPSTLDVVSVFNIDPSFSIEPLPILSSPKTYLNRPCLHWQAQPLTNLSTTQPFTILPPSLLPFTTQTSFTHTYPSYPGNTSCDFLDSSLNLNSIRKARVSASLRPLFPPSLVSFLPVSIATSLSGTSTLFPYCCNPTFTGLPFYV